MADVLPLVTAAIGSLKAGSLPPPHLLKALISKVGCGLGRPGGPTAARRAPRRWPGTQGPRMGRARATVQALQPGTPARAA